MSSSTPSGGAGQPPKKPSGAGGGQPPKKPGSWLPPKVQRNADGSMQMPDLGRKKKQQPEAAPSHRPPAPQGQSRGGGRPRDLSWVHNSFEETPLQMRPELYLHDSATPRIHIRFPGDPELAQMHPHSVDLATNIAAPMLLAFSKKARREIGTAGWHEHEVRALNVKPYPEGTMKLLTGWMGRCCRNPQNTERIATAHLDHIHYLQLWRAANELEIPTALNQLNAQVEHDVRRFDFEQTVHAWWAHRDAGELQAEARLIAALEQRLMRFAQGQHGHRPAPTTAEVNMAVITVTGVPDWIRANVGGWYSRNLARVAAGDWEGVGEDMRRIVEQIRADKESLWE